MKFALLTGTSRGIGAALARELCARGWTVTGCARGAAPDELAKTEAYTHLSVDLADREAVRRTFVEPASDSPAFAALGRAERAVVVHNAAVVATAATHAVELDAAYDLCALNVALPIWLSGWFLRAAPAESDVRVVEISSGAATSAYPGWPLYCASKAALRMAGEVLSVEAAEVDALRDRRLSVLSYAPGVVATGMQADIRGVDPALFPRRERFVELHETGKLAQPEAPAKDLARRLEAPDPPAYEVARYQA